MQEKAYVGKQRLNVGMTSYDTWKMTLSLCKCRHHAQRVLTSGRPETNDAKQIVDMLVVEQY